MSETSDPQTDGRWRRVRVALPFLEAVLRGQLDAAYDTTAPKDLLIVGLAEVQTNRDGIWTLVVWSTSFDPLPMGDDGRLMVEIPFADFQYINQP